MVIVSPLIRALDTAYRLFKTHPNFKMMRFIVDPDMREVLDINPCNIPKPW